MALFKLSRSIVARLAFAAMLSTISALTRAELITLDPTVSGAITQGTVHTIGGSFVASYSSSNPLSGLFADPGKGFGMVQGTSIAYGYLVFDLSGLAVTANAAAITFDLGYTNALAPNLAVTSLALAQAQVLAAIPPGQESYTINDVLNGTPEQAAAFNRLDAAFSAIQYGDELGKLTDSGPLSGQYTLGLNALGLDLINASDGLLAVGLTWTPHTSVTYEPVFEVKSDFLAFNATPRLILDTGNSVPLPATLWLVGAGLVGLVASKRKNA